MFRFKRASQFLERYNSAVNCALNKGDLISKDFVTSASNKTIRMYFSVLFSNQLTDFWVNLIVFVVQYVPLKDYRKPLKPPGKYKLLVDVQKHNFLITWYKVALKVPVDV